MEPYVETAIQWLHDQIRCVVLARLARVKPRGTRDLKHTRPEGEWVEMCWDIGHSLTMMQAHGIPAAPVIEAVAAKLGAEFPSVPGLGVAGILQMRQFYLDYFERAYLQSKLRRVPWSCHLLLQALCRDPLQQEFYLDLCLRKAMGPNELSKALAARAYELSAAPSLTGTAGSSLTSGKA